MGKRILIGAVVVFAALVVIGAALEAANEPAAAPAEETTPSQDPGPTPTSASISEPEDSSDGAASDEPATASTVDPGIDEADLDAVISDLENLLGELNSNFNQTEGDMQP